MMTFPLFCAKYRASYEKLQKKLCILDEPYKVDELRMAWENYISGEWYAKAFKPYALAQSNVKFYDYQIRLALAEQLTYHDDKSLLEFKASSPDTFEWAVADYYKRLYEEREKEEKN